MPSRRKALRLKCYDYAAVGAYFVTVCVWEKWECIGKIINGKMAVNECGMIVRNVWYDLINHFNFQLDEFIVMPNHVHGILMINDTKMNNVRRGSIHRTLMDEGAINRAPTKTKLGEIIRHFKAKCTKLIHEHNKCFRWQRNYYEHIIRNDADLNRVRQYIAYNPAQWADDAENPAPRQRPEALK